MKRPYCEASAEDTQPKVDADAALSKDIVKQSTMPGLPSISVIVALYNAAPYLDECLDSILAQDYGGPLEVSIHDDASTDSSRATLEAWLTCTSSLRTSQRPSQYPLTVLVSSSEVNRGAGAARNAAVNQSSGVVLVIQDADDVMRPSRVRLQVEALLKAEEEQRGMPIQPSVEADEAVVGSSQEHGAVADKEATVTPIATKTTIATGSSNTSSKSSNACSGIPTTATTTDTTTTTNTEVSNSSHAIRSSQDLEGERVHHVLIGCNFERLPLNATEHYAAWANGLEEWQLSAQRFRECTLVHPTWCLRRSTLDQAGGYPEVLAEDLRLFLKLTGAPMHTQLVKVPEALVVYRHTGGSLVARTPQKVLTEIRLRAFEEQVLAPHWCGVTPSMPSAAADEFNAQPPPSITSTGPLVVSHPRGVLGAAKSGQFAIWGAGRDGRHFYNGLAPEYRIRVACLLDVDPSKIGKPHANGRLKGSKPVPVLHWRDLPEGLPVVLCVAMGRTNGQFEANVAALATERGYKETINYWHFN